MNAMSYTVALLLLASGLTAQEHDTSEVSIPSVQDLLGAIQREQLQAGEYNVWFTKQYDGYETDKAQLKELQQRLSGVTVQLFFGTWCHDSRRQVPRFFNLMDEVGYGSANVSLIAINEAKEVPVEFGSHLDIRYTPTFIIMRGKQELGRIIETPVVSLEHDMLTILRGDPYKPNRSDREQTSSGND